MLVLFIYSAKKTVLQTKSRLKRRSCLQVQLTNSGFADFTNFLSFVHRFLPRLSHAESILLNGNEVRPDQLAHVIGLFLSDRRSAESVQTLTCQFVMKSYIRDVGRGMKEVMPDVGDEEWGV